MNGKRTPDFDKYFLFLSGVYTPSTPEDTYFLTKYLQDEELDYINNIRKQKGKNILIRFAYVGNGEYKPVNNQYEKKRLECSIFGDNPINSLDEPIELVKKGIVHIANYSVDKYNYLNKYDN